MQELLAAASPQLQHPQGPVWSELPVMGKVISWKSQELGSQMGFNFLGSLALMN